MGQRYEAASDPFIEFQIIWLWKGDSRDALRPDSFAHEPACRPLLEVDLIKHLCYRMHCSVGECGGDRAVNVFGCKICRLLGTVV